MSIVGKELLKSEKIIDDVFIYHDLDPDIAEIYSFFESYFQVSYESYARIYNIKDCCFYIKSNNMCNAFATKRSGYSIIGITNGYPIMMKRKFDEKYFRNILLISLLNNSALSNAYCDLEDDLNFDYSSFILECSMKFTFNHEFEHILQLNYDSLYKSDLIINETFEADKFDIKKHAWEFDADRMASFEVLKYVFRIYRELKIRTDETLKCLLFLGCSSMIITKCLFYFGVINQIDTTYSVNKVEFYTKENSHPLIRCFNIIEYYYSNIKNDFPKLKFEFQELFNNTIGIVKLYFDALMPNDNIIEHFFSDMDIHLGSIVQYNIELYDFAIKDKSIKSLLSLREIQIDN